MLRYVLLLLLAAFLAVPPASAQRGDKARPTAELIGDHTLKAMEAHVADRIEMSEVRRMVTGDEYAMVRRIREGVRESDLTLNQALRQLMSDDRLSAADAQLFRRLARQENADGAKRIGKLMVESPNLIVAATGASVLHMINNPEDVAGDVQAQSGNTGAQIGAGLDNIDWGDVAGDAAKGALVGGLIGGSIGAAVGAAVAGLASAVSDFLNGFLGGGGEEGGEEGGDGGGGTPAPAPAPSPAPAPAPMP
jgi:hypothetical protein